MKMKMKTKEEQIAFADKLQELTTKHGNLITELADSDNELEILVILVKIKSTLDDMDNLRDSYLNSIDS